MTTHSPIPFFPYPALFAEARAEFTQAFEAVCSRGAFIMQRELVEFEAELAAYLGVKHALGVADGSVALVIALRASGLQAGDEVIVPSHTFVASAAAVHHAGGVPVLVDCGADHLIDASKIEAAITAKTRAIMPVQLNGRVADMHALQAMADKHGLFIVEDSAQALGARFAGRFAGTFGRAGTFSFYPAKLLGCFGDGGAVVTNDDAVADIASSLRDHGRGPAGKVIGWGYNARLDNLQAAFLSVKFKTYSQALARRRAIAQRYQDGLSAVQAVKLPPAPGSEPLHFDVFQNYEIEAERRDELKAFLASEGIGTIMQWGGHLIHEFEELGCKSGDLSFSRAMVQRYLLLPMHPYLTDQEADTITAAIRRFYGS